MIRPRVLLADDHALLLDAFSRLLEPECDIVGTAADGRELLTKARALKPDIIVLDVSMPVLNGLDAGERLKRALPRARLIYLTVNEDPDLVAEAFRAGASGYVLKRCAAEELFHAIREVRMGRSYVSPLVTAGMVASLAQGKGHREASARLTPRQREVLQLLAEGRSMKEAAAILNVAPRTVAFHKYRIMNELRIRNSAQLIQFAVKNQMVAL
ncbi:MAG: response regulator transcription factor [Alphaproteobacteria bacterium]|nr:response regulator transcription factor [Alphaproteobacteria bacterium]